MFRAKQNFTNGVKEYGIVLFFSLRVGMYVRVSAGALARVNARARF